MSTISHPGGTTVYIRQNGSNIQSSINQTSWITIPAWPVTVTNSNTGLGVLIIQFTTNITLNGGVTRHFICGSSHIQFGSISLNSDGSRPIITIDGISNYLGLIQNGTASNNGFSHVSIYNIVVATNNSTIDASSGWFGHPGFGGGASNNQIINCSSTGAISQYGGGILGAECGRNAGTLRIIGCSSSGTTGQRAGGIIGRRGGAGGGTVTIQSCWSTGGIGAGSGGICGEAAARMGATVTVSNCYSTGVIGTDAGGIFGRDSEGTATAENCYTIGDISGNGGGIFGAGAGGLAIASNCYSVGSIGSNAGGIFGNGSNGTTSNCYVANGNWSNTAANAALSGDPNPILGTTWVYRGVNTPYELSNMGYTPYTINNIIESPPSLRRTYASTVSALVESGPAIVSDKSYTILDISSNNPGSHTTFSINASTGSVLASYTTVPGLYKLYVRNNGSYNITELTLTATPVLLLLINGIGSVNINGTNYSGPGSYSIPDLPASVGAMATGTESSAFTRWGILNTSVSPSITVPGYGELIANFAEAPVVTRRKYWPSQTELIDDSKPCRCGCFRAAANYASATDRARAIRFAAAGCGCCTGNT